MLIPVILFANARLQWRFGWRFFHRNLFPFLSRWIFDWMFLVARYRYQADRRLLLLDSFVLLRSIRAAGDSSASAAWQPTEFGATTEKGVVTGGARIPGSGKGEENPPESLTSSCCDLG